MHENNSQEEFLQQNSSADDDAEARAEARAALCCGQGILVSLNGTELGTGTVDDLTVDGSAVWISFNGAYGRRMFLAEDSEDIRPLH